MACVAINKWKQMSLEELMQRLKGQTRVSEPERKDAGWDADPETENDRGPRVD